jgi:hypothetical protein
MSDLLEVPLSSHLVNKGSNESPNQRKPLTDQLAVLSHEKVSFVTKKKKPALIKRLFLTFLV